MTRRLCASTLPGTPGCSICFWRRLYIHAGQAPSDEECCKCDSEVPAILTLLHTYPGEDWMHIIQTDTLGLPEVPVRRATGNRRFVRILLRIDKQHEQIHYVPHDKYRGDYVYEGRHMRPFETVTVFQGTCLSSLVHSTRDWGGGKPGQRYSSPAKTGLWDLHA